MVSHLRSALATEYCEFSHQESKPFGRIQVENEGQELAPLQPSCPPLLVARSSNPRPLSLSLSGSLAHLVALFRQATCCLAQFSRGRPFSHQPSSRTAVLLPSRPTILSHQHFPTQPHYSAAILGWRGVNEADGCHTLHILYYILRNAINLK